MNYVIPFPFQDVQLGEYKLDKGTEIRLITSIPHRDSSNYEDPYAFNPERWLKNQENEGKESKFFAPFGMGHKQVIIIK